MASLQKNPWGQLYNTELTPQEEQAYQQWAQALAQNRGWDPQYVDYDYDMRGYWKDNDSSPKGGHYPDTYKKPNHPTFSQGSMYSGVNGNTGGQWVQDQNGNYVSFIPSPTNAKMHSYGFLEDYFRNVEPGITIDWTRLFNGS